jgi:hypothetical protein
MLAAKFEPGETMVSQRASARSPPKTRRAGGEESSSTANVGQAARTGSSVKLFQRKSAKTQDNYFVQIAVFGAAGDNSSMSSRELVIELVTRLPENTPLTEIEREIELLAGIQAAREQARRSEGIPAEEARKLVDAWASK